MSQEKIKLAKNFYFYSKYYHAEHIKCVTLRENWEEKDFDTKYCLYIQEYEKINETINKTINNYDNYTEEKHIKALEIAKEDKIKKVYILIFEAMKENFKKNKIEISNELYSEIDKRLDNFRNLKELNKDFLKEIRKIEEEIFEKNSLIK